MKYLGLDINPKIDLNTYFKLIPLSNKAFSIYRRVALIISYGVETIIKKQLGNING